MTSQESDPAMDYEVFGYNHAALTKVEIQEILDNDGIAYDKAATVRDLLPLIETLYAVKRLQDGTATRGYLRDGFGPWDYSASQLRQVLSFHGISYHCARHARRSRPTKPDLISTLIANVEDMRDSMEWAPSSLGKSEHHTIKVTTAYSRSLIRPAFASYSHTIAV